MSSLTLGIKQSPRVNGKIVVQIDAGKFERLAANFGFFNNDFLDSLDRAENDIKAGRVRKAKSLRDLRNK